MSPSRILLFGGLLAACADPAGKAGSPSADTTDDSGRPDGTDGDSGTGGDGDTGGDGGDSDGGDTGDDTGVDPALLPTAVIACGPAEATTFTEWTADGSGSIDPTGTGLQARWRLLPENRAAHREVSDALDDYTVRSLLSGDHEVELVVTNTAGDSAPARCPVRFVPSDALVVELLAETESTDPIDWDLHLAHGDAALFETPGDASWCNSSAPGPDETPDTDDDIKVGSTQDRTGAIQFELAQVAAPGPEPHVVRVHLYRDDTGDTPATAELRLWHDGALITTLAPPALEAREVWEVGTFDPVTATWTPSTAPVAAATRSNCY